jgi:hypothetical protein
VLCRLVQRHAGYFPALSLRRNPEVTLNLEAQPQVGLHAERIFEL